MKKILALLLGVVTCFSLIACAQAETNNNEVQEQDIQSSEQEKETIEIMIDNWQDYFEIKQCLDSYITTNDFDEPTEFSYHLTTFFTKRCIKVDSDLFKS